MTDPSPAHRALDEAIRAYVAEFAPGEIVTEWFLPFVTVAPEYDAGEVSHSFASSGIPLHSRVGILTYHLANAKQDMIRSGQDDDDD